MQKVFIVNSNPEKEKNTISFRHNWKNVPIFLNYFKWFLPKMY